MKVLLGLLRAYRRSRKMASGVLITMYDTDTNQVSWVLVRNVGTERVTYTGHVRQLETYLKHWS
jgi:hypothetical protein